MTRFIFGLSLVLAAGCTPTIQFQLDTTPPAEVTLTSTQIIIPEGVTVGVHAQPMVGGSEMPSTTDLEFTPEDVAIVGMQPAEGDNFLFVIYGVSPGTTTVDYSANNGPQGQIAVTVTPATDG